MLINIQSLNKIFKGFSDPVSFRTHRVTARNNNGISLLEKFSKHLGTGPGLATLIDMRRGARLIIIAQLLNTLGCVDLHHHSLGPSSEGPSPIAKSPDPQTEPLKISPEKITISAGEITQFQISGGAGDYYWKVEEGSGDVFEDGTFYSESAPGESKITVTDSKGNSISAQITSEDHTEGLNANDTQFPALTALFQISAPEAWNIRTDCTPTRIAVLDTGVEYTHPDLGSNIWTNTKEIPGNKKDDDGNGYIDDVHGYDFVNSDGDPNDDNGHGTHVTGTIAAIGNNNRDVTGICWKAQVMAAKFLDKDGGGAISDAALAIQYAIKNKAKILNNSWGITQGYGASAAAIKSTRDLLTNPLKTVSSAGALFVAAAGNEGVNTDQIPNLPSTLQDPSVIAVGALGNQKLATFSNYGSTNVDIAAPGVDILSLFIHQGVQVESGTSMATPQVTGLTALLWSEHPELSANEAKERLLARSQHFAGLNGKLATSAAINAYQALTEPIERPSVVRINGITITDELGNEISDVNLEEGFWITVETENLGSEEVTTPRIDLQLESDKFEVSHQTKTLPTHTGHLVTRTAIGKITSTDDLQSGGTLPLQITVQNPNSRNHMRRYELEVSGVE